MSQKYGKQKWCRTLGNPNRYNVSKVTKYVDLDYARRVRFILDKKLDYIKKKN